MTSFDVIGLSAACDGDIVTVVTCAHADLAVGREGHQTLPAWH